MSEFANQSRWDSPSIGSEALDAKAPQGFSYFAYGLSIQSELPLPEFMPAEKGHDVTIQVDYDRNPNEYVPAKLTAQSFATKLSHDQVAVHVQGTGVFLVQGGHTIVVIPTSDASAQQIRLALVDTVMAILLNQRGLLVLHASAVNMDGAAVAFLDNSDQGKASIAATLQAQGYNILTEVVTAVSLDQGAALISPGRVSPKVGSNPTDALDGDSDEPNCSLQRLDPKESAQGQTIHPSPLPIQCLYILTSGSELRIEPLRPQEAVIELVQRSGLSALMRARDTLQLFKCATLAKTCPVYRLQCPRNVTSLPELALSIEQHVTCQRAKCSLKQALLERVKARVSNQPNFPGTSVSPAMTPLSSLAF